MLKPIKKIIKWCGGTLSRKIISCLVIVSIIMSFFWFWRLKTAEAGWYDQDWLYRKSIPITNNTTAETNRYVSVTIDTSDTTKFQTDCGDLRFTKLNGVLLKYYISSGCGTASTVIQVLFDTLQAGAQTIYFYYGNPSADNGFEGAGFSTVASNYTVGSIGSEEKGLGPVLWLKLDEGYGTIAYDFTDQGNDFTLSAESWTDSGKFGRAWDGDGAKWLSRANDDDFNFTAATDFSISMWFKSDSTSPPGANEFLIEKKASSAGYAIYTDTNGDVIFGIDDDTDWTPNDKAGDVGRNFYDNTWHNVVAVKTGTTRIDIYVDGVLIDSDVSIISTLTLENSALLYIGDSDGADNGDEFTGDIDEVKFYRYARSAAQVKRDYNQGFGARLGGEFTPPSGLVGWWKMDEAQDNTCAGGTNDVCDSSSNANDGAITGATWKGAADCKFGSCLSFDGDGDYVTVNDSNSLDITNAITISAWIYPLTGGGGNLGRIVSKEVTTAAAPYALQMRTLFEQTQLEITTNQGTKTGISPTISLNRWTHIVGTWNGSQIITYANGVAGTATNLSGTMSATANNVLIGNNPTNTRAFNGIIDEVMIFNRALSQKEIVAVMLGTRPPVAERTSAPGSMMGYWKFDAGYGTTTFDSSGLGNSLTLSAESWTDSGKFGRAWDGNGAKWLSRADDPDFDFTAAENFSLTGWFKSDSADNPGSNEFLINKATSSAGYAVYLDTSGDVVFGIDDDSTWNPDDDVGNVGRDFYDNTWHHFVAVKTGTSTIELYVDAISLGSTAVTATGTLENSALLYIGDRDGADNGDEFTGDIDEVKIYRFALTADDVKLEYNRGKAVQMGGQRSQAETYCPPGFTGTCTPPVGYWKMDEAADNTCALGVNDVCDSSANANDGAINGNPVWKGAADCKFGSCLSFDGSGDYVQIADKDQLSFTDGISDTPFTISFWFSKSKHSMQFISKYNSTGDQREWMFTDGATDELVFALWSGVSTARLGHQTTGQNYSLNVWYHFVVTYDGSKTEAGIKFYANGREATSYTTYSSGTYTGTINGTAPVIVGGYVGNYTLGGSLDNLMIFNRALTQGEVAWIYNKGKPVGHWKMNEGEGTTAKDSSVNNLSGTISGASWTSSGKYNSGLDFDGTDDVVTVTKNSIIDLKSKTSYAISAWIYPHTSGESDANGGQFISKGTNTYMRVDTSSGGRVNVSASLGLATPATLTISSAIPLNTWSHILMAYTDDSDDEITIYINGVNMGSSTNGDGSPADDSASDLLIGGSTTANFDGIIDEVKIFNYELTPEQVKMDYNQGAAIRFGD